MEKSGLRAALDAVFQVERCEAPAVSAQPKTRFMTVSGFRRLSDTVYKAMVRLRDAHESRMDAMEVRLQALETGASLRPKAVDAGRIVRTAGEPHLAPAHAVGDVIAVVGGENWRCVGPNRYRRIV